MVPDRGIDEEEEKKSAMTQVHADGLPEDFLFDEGFSSAVLQLFRIALLSGSHSGLGRHFGWNWRGNLTRRDL